MFAKMRKFNLLFKVLVSFAICVLLVNLIILPSRIQAEGVFTLPASGTMMTPTPAFIPAAIKGMQIFENNPLRFDFIIDTGQSELEDESLKKETNKLVKYFLAALTVPAEDLWVNLSPYEKDRVIPEKFGFTQMGRDLLRQDYILKQLTASLIYPERSLGKNFWDRVYAKVYKLYGSTEISINTFNKVWIVLDKALIYVSGDTAFISNIHLKAMVENDYWALQENLDSSQRPKHKREINDTKTLNDISSSIVREVIIPEIEKEINEGENFANLRQISYAMVLATWYKRNLKESLLGKLYVDHNKIDGVDVEDKNIKEKIYQQYLKAFKIGVYDYVKQDYNSHLQEIIERRYISGGYFYNPEALHQKDVAVTALIKEGKEATQGNLFAARVFVDPIVSGLTPPPPKGKKALTVEAYLNNKRGISSGKEHDSRDIYQRVARSIQQEKRKPRVLLIQSNLTGLNNFYPPLGLYYLRASLKKFMNIEAEILDMGVGPLEQKEIEERLKKKLQELQPDIVGISFVTASSGNAFKTADIVKEWNKDVIIAAGGVHPNAVSVEKILKDKPFDLSFKKESEISFSNFVKAISLLEKEEELLNIQGINIKFKDKIIDTGEASIITDLDALPFPSLSPEEIGQYDVWIVNPQKKAMPILTTRGCPYGCTFCTKGVFGRKLRKRSVENIVEEVKSYYQQGYRNFYFIDDAITADRKWLERLSKTIIKEKLKINWRAMARTNTMSYELLRTMKRSGCISLAFGIESGSQRILDNVIGKGTKVNVNLKAIEMAKKAGIEEIRLFVMVGLPGETASDIKKTINFVKKADPTNVGLTVAIPMPGSEWGNNLNKFGTTLLGKIEDSLSYQKEGSSGKYKEDTPVIVHETQELNRAAISRLYVMTKRQLSNYLYDPAKIESKFVYNEVKNNMDVFREVGLFDLLEDSGLTLNNVESRLAVPMQIILKNYQEWRRLDFTYDNIWEKFDVENPDSIARKMILKVIWIHILSSLFKGETAELCSIILNNNPPPIESESLVAQIDKLSIIMQAASLLNEKKLTNLQYQQIIKTYAGIIENSILKNILKRLEDFAIFSSFPRPDISSPETPGRSEELGGINLNPEALDLEVQGNGLNFKMPFNLKDFQMIPIRGVNPVILEIVPITLPSLISLGKMQEWSLS